MMPATTSPIQRVLGKLSHVKREREGQWQARCPAHDDRTPSLSVGVAADGKLLLHCQAGCPTESVLAKLGFTKRDLFAVDREVSPRAPDVPMRREMVAAYDYQDEDGKLLFQVCRYAPKDFRQRKPDGDGGWSWHLNGTRRVLYRLPEVLEAVALDKPTYVVEGEKDADRLVALGLTATTVPGGAGKWLPEYCDSLRDARVIVLPDNDQPGRNHAQLVARELEGIAQSVRVLELPGLPPKGDVSDWLDQGHTVEELAQLIATEPTATETKTEIEIEPGPKLYTLISDLEAEHLPPPEWAVDGIYPHGGLVVVFGPRGLGKTFLVLGWSFCHATGLPWLTRTVKPGPVVYIMGEGRGGLGVRVRAQKEHLGIQGEAGVHFITTAVPMLNDAEVARLIATIATLPEKPVAVVWDTLSRTFIGGDENSSRDMATYVAAIDRVKDAVGGTAIVQHHTGHGSTDRERGSSVLGGAADTIVALRDREGSLELGCEKMKDSGEFKPLLLNLRPVGQSCVILLHDPAWSNGGFLSAIERQALQVLHGCSLPDGLSTTAWLKASGMAESSFYKARKELAARHLVDPVKVAGRERYVVSETGLAMLKLHGSTVTP